MCVDGWVNGVVLDWHHTALQRWRAMWLHLEKDDIDLTGVCIAEHKKAAHGVNIAARDPRKQRSCG